MMNYFAHSATERLPPQLYSNHVYGTQKLAEHYTDDLSLYCNNGNSLKQIVGQATTWHDLGKLEAENQEVLKEGDNKRCLPLNHVDAGTKYLLSRDAQCSALIVYSHHHGLPNLIDEMERGDLYFRDHNEVLRKHTDQTYIELAKTHLNIINDQHAVNDTPPNNTPSIFYRMCLSCLADADYNDTARFYNGFSDNQEVQLKAKERLESLNRYVQDLSNYDDKNSIRDEVYNQCKSAKIKENFSLCVAPVGSGKTTAVMAHLLQQAIERKARRIFVILPYISIIQQSVDVYRKALVLPTENPEEVIAEVHHLVDYDNPMMQKYSTAWKAPVVVTTAAAFFETLSSNRPSVLRKLHELPGSVIFVDEAHTMLPTKYIPLAWKWMEILANEWGCYWTFASGSAIKFWEINQLVQTQEYVPEILDSNLTIKLSKQEEKRIEYKWCQVALQRDELESMVLAVPGPRLLILNTIQNAAVIADDLRNIVGRERVEHLSTALTPNDRGLTIQRIYKRLANPDDNDWTLVATSCVEAGMDFSFRTGFREIASLSSLIQTSGRVNRNGEYGCSTVFSFTLAIDKMLNKNAKMDGSANVLRQYFEKEIAIHSDLVTDSIKKELTQYGCNAKYTSRLMKEEEACSFVDVADNMRHIIGDDTIPVLVDLDLVETIRNVRCNRNIIQKHSVSIPRYHIDEWGISKNKYGVHTWTLDYNNFLGYMAGILPIIKMRCGDYFV